MKIKISSMFEVWWNVYCLIDLHILIQAILPFFYLTVDFVRDPYIREECLKMKGIFCMIDHISRSP